MCVTQITLITDNANVGLLQIKNIIKVKVCNIRHIYTHIVSITLHIVYYNKQLTFYKYHITFYISIPNV